MKPTDIHVILGTPHGVNVAGKRSPDGRLREYRYGREIVAALKGDLEALGYVVHVDIEADRVPDSQSQELTLRCGMVNTICQQYGAKNCIYVSVHVNASGMGDWMQARGWCVFTSVGRTKADTLATCIWNEADRVLPKAHKYAVRADMSDGDPDYEKNYYVLAHTACPAVLTENLFMDNREDMEYLLSEEGRRAIVELHREGIVRYTRIEAASRNRS
jgi:N-acetylmuramoyl-L-alanine amidase